MPEARYRQNRNDRSLRRSQTNTKSSTYFRPPVCSAFPCLRITLRAYLFRKCSTSYWEPLGERTWAPGVRFGHQTLRKQRSNMTNLVVIPGGVPGLSWAASGLLLGCWGSLRALWLPLAAPGPLLGRSWSKLAGTKGNHENDVNLTNLKAQIKATANFLGLRVVLAS